MSQPHTRETTPGFARIDVVDNRHKDWAKVLRALGAYSGGSGGGAALHVDGDGWLSARQNLLVAFVHNEPAAHVCFHVEPAHAPGRSKRACIEAQLDSYGINPKFCGHGIEHVLRKAALERANTLKCRKLHGFDLNEKWC